MKELVAKAIAKRVKNGQVIGLGSGSTAELAILEIGKKVREEKLTVFGVPSSYRVAALAAESGIQVLSAVSGQRIEWGFDGADEVDRKLRLIKGNGAAMLMEKVVARRIDHWVILVTGEKLVVRLGSKFAVPVAVIPEAYPCVIEELQAIGSSKVTLRESRTKYGPEVTEQGHVILDAWFSEIDDQMESRIKNIVGVVESGLFFGYADEIFVAHDGKVVSQHLEGSRLVETELVI